MLAYDCVSSWLSDTRKRSTNTIACSINLDKKTLRKRRYNDLGLFMIILLLYRTTTLMGCCKRIRTLHLLQYIAAITCKLF